MPSAEFEIRRETYFGVGEGVNGTGKRPARTAWSVFRGGRRVRVFDVTYRLTEDEAKQRAEAWAAELAGRSA